jgi:hypothetical protein
MLVTLNGFFNVQSGKVIANESEFTFDTSRNNIEDGIYFGTIKVDQNYNAYSMGLTETDIDLDTYEGIQTLVKISVTGACIKVTPKTSKAGKEYLSAMVVAFGGKKDDTINSAQFFSAIVSQEKPFLGNIVTITGDFKAVTISDNDEAKPRNEFQLFGLGMDNSRIALAGWASSTATEGKGSKKPTFKPQTIKVGKKAKSEATEEVTDTAF